MFKVKDLCRELNEPEQRIRYWLVEMEKAELITPQRRSTSKLYSADDLEKLRQLQAQVREGLTAPEVTRLMLERATPSEWKRAAVRASRQIAILQKKLLQIRQPWYVRAMSFLRSLFFWPRKSSTGATEKASE